MALAPRTSFMTLVVAMALLALMIGCTAAPTDAPTALKPSEPPTPGAIEDAALAAVRATIPTAPVEVSKVTTVVCPELTTGDTYVYQVDPIVDSAGWRPLLLEFKGDEWEQIEWKCTECHGETPPASGGGQPGVY